MVPHITLTQGLIHLPPFIRVWRRTTLNTPRFPHKSPKGTWLMWCGTIHNNHTSRSSFLGLCGWGGSTKTNAFNNPWIFLSYKGVLWMKIVRNGTISFTKEPLNKKGVVQKQMVLGRTSALKEQPLFLRVYRKQLVNCFYTKHSQSWGKKILLFTESYRTAVRLLKNLNIYIYISLIIEIRDNTCPPLKCKAWLKNPDIN